MRRWASRCQASVRSRPWNGRFMGKTATPSAPARGFRTASDLPREQVYGPDRLPDFAASIGNPGAWPFTRGLHATGYRGRLWTMRQYAGFGTAAESNRRYRYLLEQGTTGLSVAFDLPTQIGYDSDDPHALGEVGRVGVAIDSLEDMETLLEGIPLDTSLHLDDDQRHRRDPARPLRRGGATARHPGGRALGHGPERHPEGVRGPRDLHLSARRPRCASSPTSSPTAPSTCRGGTRSRSRATTSARRGPRRRRRSPSRSPTPSSTCAPRGRRASIPIASASGSRSSSPATPTSSRRWRSSGPRAGCGRAS